MACVPLIGFKTICICCTFRSWVHEIVSHYRTVSPRLGDNYASKFSSGNFPHTIIYITMCGKLSELNCNAVSASNCGEKVIKWRKIVGQICPIVFLVFQTFSPGLENKEISKCLSERFPCMVTYILSAENCLSYILTHSYLQIAGRVFYNVNNFHGPRTCVITFSVPGYTFYLV